MVYDRGLLLVLPEDGTVQSRRSQKLLLLGRLSRGTTERKLCQVRSRTLRGRVFAQILHLGCVFLKVRGTIARVGLFDSTGKVVRNG